MSPVLLGKTMTEGSVDRISRLPVEIIHHILSFLPTRDTHKTSILSKTFLTSWNSFPVIALDYATFPLPHRVFSLRDRSEEFKKALHRIVEQRKLQETHYVRKLKLDFLLYVDYRDTTEAHGIDEAICFAVRNGLEELSLNLGRTYSPLPIITGSSNSIRILKLKGMGLKSLHDLIARCPVLETLCIKSCHEFRNLDIFSTRIRSIKLRYCSGLEKIEIGSSSLETFVYVDRQWPDGYASNFEINISRCTSLKVLSLENAGITDKWVEDTVPQLIQLRDLKFDACPRLQSLRISNGNLKRVELLRCRDLLCSIEIVGRRVEYVNFDGSQTCDVKFVDTPLLISTCSPLHDLYDIYFATLQSFVNDVFDHDYDNIVCTWDKDLVIRKKVRGKFVDPLYAPKHLEISCFQKISVELVDSLLWVFPMVESVCFVSDNVNRWISVVGTSDPSTIKRNQRKRRANSKRMTELHEEDGIIKPDDLMHCCLDLPEKCWRHNTKTIALKNFNASDCVHLTKYFEQKGKVVSIENGSAVARSFI